MIFWLLQIESAHIIMTRNHTSVIRVVKIQSIRNRTEQRRTIAQFGFILPQSKMQTPVRRRSFVFTRVVHKYTRARKNSYFCICSPIEAN